MQRKRVESSMLRSTGYDLNERILEVDEETYRELIAAESVGRYFNDYIRDGITDIRVR